MAKVWVSREREGPVDGFKESMYGIRLSRCDSQPGDPDFGRRQTESVTPNSPTRRTIDCEHHDQKAGAIYVTWPNPAI